MWTNKIGALGIFLALNFQVSSQNIGFGLSYEPASFTISSGVTEIQEPVNGYDFQSLSKPKYALNIFRQTKNNLFYGIGVAHLTNAFYASFNYRVPRGQQWEISQLNNIFETRHLGINLFVGKQWGRISYVQNFGTFNNYDFSSRVPQTTGGFGYVAHLSSTFEFQDGELIGVREDLGATQHFISKPNSAMSTLTLTSKFGYEISKNLEVGFSIRWHASNPDVVDFQNFEDQFFSQQGDPANFVLDERNRIGKVIIRVERLGGGLFLRYGLSKPLTQKRKKRKQQEKLIESKR